MFLFIGNNEILQEEEIAMVLSAKSARDSGISVSKLPCGGYMRSVVILASNEAVPTRLDTRTLAQRERVADPVKG